MPTSTDSYSDDGVMLACLQDLAGRFASDAVFVRFKPLFGGVTFRTYVVETNHPKRGTERWTVRFAPEDEVCANPDFVEREFRLVKHLSKSGLPVPEPVLYLSDCGPSKVPTSVYRFIEGTTEFQPQDRIRMADQTADVLRMIHSIDISAMNLPGVGDPIAGNLARVPQKPDQDLRESLVREALSAAFPNIRYNPPCLVHGDIWAGNLLFQDGMLTGIIDWEDGKVGDPLFDLATARLECLWAFGRDAMNRLTDRYLEISGIDHTYLPLFDLNAALNPMGQLADWSQSWPDVGRGDVTYETMVRDHHFFVDQALNQL